MSKKRHKASTRYANKLRSAARRKLGTLLDIQQDKCKDCAARVVDAPLLIRTTLVARIDAQAGTIEYLVPYSHGRWTVSLIATIDHVHRIADGGGNDITNLEVVCAPCHRAREKVRKDTRGAEIRSTLKLTSRSRRKALLCLLKNPIKGLPVNTCD